ncbi:MAG TPA: hypothetical protein PKH39_10190 [Woeseiaceae bacterium]|nr:hypothetical protein [Woeseiaceae bacterium]
MAELFHFKPAGELAVERNLAEFVKRCQTELVVFGEELVWADWRWPGVGQFVKAGLNARSAKSEDAFDDEFIDFAKAYVRYKQGHHRTKVAYEFLALRCIEPALKTVTGRARIIDTNVATLDEAALLARELYKGGTAYRAGKELQRLAVFVSENRLTFSELGQWRSPIKTKGSAVRTGEKAKKQRERKLPNTEAMNALAEVFASGPTAPRDIFTTSLFAMTMCAPVRLSELLELEEDCEVDDTDSAGKPCYGWRFVSGKGYGANIKWIPTEMVSIARTAVQRIRELTKPARKLAAWIESGTDEFFPHSEMPDTEPGAILSGPEMNRAMRTMSPCGKPNYAAIRRYGVRFGRDHYTLGDLWKIVVAKQPDSFPYLTSDSNTKFSGGLFSMTRNLLSGARRMTSLVLWTPNVNHFNQDLRSAPNHKGEISYGFFHRHGYKALNGDPLRLSSHQARHLLNTYAQRGGLSQIEIARWSGRLDPNQNRTYNHESEFEMVKRANELDVSSEFFGPDITVGTNQPVTSQEINLGEVGSAHITEYGVCIHDYTMSPCQMYRDCLSCEELVCVKGDQAKLDRIRTRRVAVEEQYQQCIEAIENGLAGADRWYEHHKAIRKRISELVSVLEDPRIEDGALIQLRGSVVVSPLKRALRASEQSLSGPPKGKLVTARRKSEVT